MKRNVCYINSLNLSKTFSWDKISSEVVVLLYYTRKPRYFCDFPGLTKYYFVVVNNWFMLFKKKNLKLLSRKSILICKSTILIHIFTLSVKYVCVVCIPGKVQHYTTLLSKDVISGKFTSKISKWDRPQGAKFV